MEGIVFAGCSFTYGHGLEYYSTNNKFISNPETQITTIQNLKLIETRKKLRFAKIVADYFDTFEVVKLETSGNDQESIKFLKTVFGESPIAHHIIRGFCDYDDVEYIIFQTSYPDRCSIKLESGHDIILGSHQDLKGNINDEFFEIIKKNNIETFESFYEIIIKQLYNEVKKTLEYYESKNIKCLIWNMRNDYNDLLIKDNWMNKRLITFDYNNKKYDSWVNLVEDGNSILEIINDKDFFGEITPDDRHPSKMAHRILADGIIKKIKHREENEKDY